MSSLGGPDEHGDTEARFRTYFALLEVAALVQHGVEGQLRDDGGLSLLQFQLLATLHGSEAPMTMTEVADRLVHSRSGLTYQVQRLVTQGLVARRTAKNDERSATLSLTASGRRRLDRVLPGHVDLVQELVNDSLSLRDLDRLGRLLARVGSRLRERPPRSATPRT